MYNKYMFSYLLINVEAGQVEHVLGTKESVDHYTAEQDLRDMIGGKFSEADGWELKSLILNVEPVEYVSERV